MQYANITVVNPKYVEVHECLFRKFNRTAGGLSIVFSFKEDFDNSFSVSLYYFALLDRKCNFYITASHKRLLV